MFPPNCSQKMKILLKLTIMILWEPIVNNLLVFGGVHECIKYDCSQSLTYFKNMF